MSSSLIKKPTQSGLTTAEAEQRLAQHGPNDVAEKQLGFVKKILAYLLSPISLMLLVAAGFSFFNQRMFDSCFILVLYAFNFAIQRWQEFKADKAIRELRSKLLFQVSVLRDGTWSFVNATVLVPGDRIRIGLGSMIPADAKVLLCQNLTVNEAALTGESLPKEKQPKDLIYSGTFITTGNVEAEVTATGATTSFGKTIFSIEQPAQKSLLEQDILRISRFLTVLSLGAVCILSVVFLYKGSPLNELLTLDISLIIAGIPVALPAVMAFVLSIGAMALGKKMVIVRRLSALQDLANVNLLLTDKTGTLTKNSIQVVNVISYDKNYSTDDIVELASYATQSETPGAIDLAILKRLKERSSHPSKTRILAFIPYDPDRKRTTALVQRSREQLLVSLGAPQVIQKLDEFGTSAMKRKFERDIHAAAADGYRSLALAIKQGGKEEQGMTMVGLLSLADPLEETAKQTIQFMRENGIDVKMVTGDNHLIAQRILSELGQEGRTLSGEETRAFIERGTFRGKAFNTIGAFSEILPHDKYELVNGAKQHFVVAATGDGINDLLALKTANVGIAVSGAVSALKSVADIVLLGQGISVITDGILEARKIFTRLYNYSVYRISESFRLIVTILVLGALYGFYPLVPLQLILLALLNDIPIISLAVDRVKVSSKPSEIHVRERLVLSLLFGSVGVVNSLILFFLMTAVFHLSLPVIQTIFFLKLTVSGHLLVFVAHTKERWYRFLPSKQVVVAIFATQGIATILALTGFLMPAKLSFVVVVCVWLWAFVWMQVSEGMKYISQGFSC